MSVFLWLPSRLFELFVRTARMHSVKGAGANRLFEVARLRNLSGTADDFRSFVSMFFETRLFYFFEKGKL